MSSIQNENRGVRSMGNIGQSDERLAEMLQKKPKQQVEIPKYPGSDKPLEAYNNVQEPSTEEERDPFAPAVLADHIHEFEKNGKKHRVAELNMSVTYKIVKRGKRWFEAVVTGVSMTKALVEINEATEQCLPWHTYEFTGRVTVDCTYHSFRRIYIYPTKV